MLRFLRSRLGANCVTENVVWSAIYSSAVWLAGCHLYSNIHFAKCRFLYENKY